MVAVRERKPAQALTPGFGRQSPQLVFDLVGSGYHQSVQLVYGLGAGFGRRTAGHRKHPYCFHPTVAAFGHRSGLSGACIHVCVRRVLYCCGWCESRPERRVCDAY